MKVMNFVVTHTHRKGSSTEIQAAGKAAKSAPSIKKRILHRLSEEGPRGLTPDEFCEESIGLINTVRRRFTDLWKEGKIRHHPTLIRKNNAGNECTVWVLGTDPDLDKNLSMLEKLKAENAQLRSLFESNG